MGADYRVFRRLLGATPPNRERPKEETASGVFLGLQDAPPNAFVRVVLDRHDADPLVMRAGDALRIPGGFARWWWMVGDSAGSALSAGGEVVWVVGRDVGTEMRAPRVPALYADAAVDSGLREVGRPGSGHRAEARPMPVEGIWGGELVEDGVRVGAAVLPNDPGVSAGSAALLFNGTSWDRARANGAMTEALPLEPRAEGSTPTAWQTAHNARGLLVFFSVVGAPASGNLKVAVEVEDVGGGAVRLVEFATVTFTGTYRYAVAPGAGSPSGVLAGLTGWLPCPIPRRFRISVVNSAAALSTYGVKYLLTV